MQPQTTTIHLSLWNEHTALQRVLLAFSRRRMRVRSMQFVELDADRPSELQIDCEGCPRLARDLVRQLERMVEVQGAWLEPAPQEVARAVA
ncbi:MAG: hypothetical protein H6983_04585 [Ectothiorhodospiraceae bacterium]|nr:hypothetical protein [Ectothiorhodospiraceae bacterium]